MAHIHLTHISIFVFFNPLYENVYEKPNTIQSFGLQIISHFENSHIKRERR